ncbi:Clp protease N-terminal domain-containing protein, partial [Cupriavidus plantarum]
MRLDKFTTRFQEALSDAQSLALGNDNQYIEPQHLLRALLAQNDGAARALLSRAGVNVNGLQTALDAAIKRLPQVSGTNEVQIGRDLVNLLNATEKEAIKRNDQFIASELFLLAVSDDKGET